MPAAPAPSPWLARGVWRAALVLAIFFAALSASDRVVAATPREWVFAQRMMLNERSSTLCYDRRSLRRDGTQIRVLVRHHFASHALAEDCQAPPGETDGITVESEILIRCSDRRWMEAGGAQRLRAAPPPMADRWRDARADGYGSLVDRVCTGAPQATTRRPSSGTGFFVDAQGNVLTNHHVVASCRQVEVVLADRRWRAVIVAGDPAADLALLKAGTTSTAFASFRAAAPPRVGEAVTAVGFPLRGLLASGPIVSTGIVNAAAGIRDDATRFQISAPVQSGNSGGPVLDTGGNVIGVVVSKLDAMRVARETGDLPQNINFAVKGDVARAFLETHGVRARTGSWTRSIDPVGIAAIARAMTVAVECR